MKRKKNCFHCGLTQEVPDIPDGKIAVCVRCGEEFSSPDKAFKTMEITFATALASLILFIPGLWIPLMRIERFGQVKEAGVLDGSFTLLRDGHLFLGCLILCCSVCIPIMKLGSLLLLSFHPRGLGPAKQVFLFRLVKVAGRWGMLDVMLIAILTAFVKLGDVVEITPGAGIGVFSLAVFLSLISSSYFEPQTFWILFEAEEAV